MKKSTSISGIISYYAVAFFALLLLAAMASCSTVRQAKEGKPEGDTRGSFWYGKRAENVKFHEGQHTI